MGTLVYSEETFASYVPLPLPRNSEAAGRNFGARRPIAAIAASNIAGVVPQHPATTFVPNSLTNTVWCFANCAGVRL